MGPFFVYMPYSGIPAGSALEAKIERCVERVMAGGSDKSAAIAICRSSLEKRAMDEKDEKQIGESAAIETDEKMDYPTEHNPVLGAMSFAELDAMERAQEQSHKLSRIIDKFMGIVRNITNNPAIDPVDRSAAIRDVTEEMRMRLDADFERGERTISLPTINGKLDPVYLQKLSESDETFEFAIGNPPFDSPHNTGFKVLKAVDGSFRWLGWVSNKYMDREGEILTDEAHSDFVAWLDQNPLAAPELWTYHIPGTGRKNKTDFWGYLNGFLLLGGKLTESEAKALLDYKGDLGMSHGFYVLEKEGNLINKYRTFEATVLPRKAAANLWTKFTVKELEDMALTKEQHDMLVNLHGEDFATALESDTSKMSAVLNDAGVQSKEKTEGVTGGGKGDGSVAGGKIPDDAVLVEEIPATEQEVEAVLNAADLAKNVAELVTKQLNPAGLQQAIKAVHDLGEANATAIDNLTKRLEALELTDDEKIAKELAPRNVTGIDWMGGFRASQAKETVIQENEKETFEKAKPNESWVTEAFTLGG